MATVSPQEFESLWVREGGDPQVATVMAALMQQQSSGNPEAVNTSDPGPNGSVGLMQINSAAHPDLFAQYGGANGLKDAVTNVRAAVQLYKESGFQPWATVDAPGGGTMENPVVTAYKEGKDPMSAVGQPGLGTAGASNGGVTAGSSAPRPPMEGADLRNFHGYDLTAIPKDELGNTEYAIQTYISNPNQTISSPTYDAAGNVTGSLESSIAERLKSDYGYGSWATKVPQLNAVLIAAVVNGWDQNTFIGAVSNTQWWKTTNENQRNWQITQSTDPGKAEEELNQARAKVFATANQLGVQLSAGTLAQIAYRVASNSATITGILGANSGVTQEQIDQFVVKAANLDKQTQQGSDIAGTPGQHGLFGTSAQIFDNFQKLSQQYLVPLNNQQLVKYVQDALGTFTGANSFGNTNLINGATNNFEIQMKQQAASLYPTMAKAIAAGTTPQTFVQPYQSVIGQTLGVDPNSVTFTDPKWNWVLQPAGPGSAPATLDQVQQRLITDPRFGYDQTNNAVQSANSIVKSLNQAFGTGG